MTYIENNRHKEIYHPLFVILFIMELLPKEAIDKIPPNTKKYWRNKNLQNTFGAEYCALYIKHFNDVSYAHKYTFVRQTFYTALAIQKTFLEITENSLQYKKLIRSKASNIVQHITTLVNKGFSLKHACKLFGIKKSWYHYHKRKIVCPMSFIRACFKQRPNQLTANEQKIIKEHLELDESKGKNLTQLYYELLNTAKLFCSKNTFCLYAYNAGYKKKFLKPKAKRKDGFRANAIFEYLHIDTTFVPTKEDNVQKVAIVKDNYSKAPLHYVITENLNSACIRKLLEETFAKFKLHERSNNINIISDGGSENNGEVIQWVESIKAPPCVKKITAKTVDFHHSNSMIEGLFHLFKNDFLNKEILANKIVLTKKLDEFFDHCLNRYFSELQGLTPQEILNGETIDKQRFSKQIKQAQQNRREANKAYNCQAMPKY
jgi:hypothetical protein